MELECVVRGGVVATAGETFTADIGIRAGKIAAIGTSLPPGEHEIDAGGHIVVPGAIDVHTHLAHHNDRNGDAMADDYESGTRAAAAGGITCVLNFAFQVKGEPLRAAVEQELRQAEGRAHIDFGLHVGVTDPSVPGVLAEIGLLVEEGISSVKIFTVTSAYGLGDADVLRILEVCGDLGILVSVHAEDQALIRFLTNRFLSQGQTAVEYFPRARPPVAEELATWKVATYARALDCPVYFVHLSSQEALEAVRRARSEGARIYVETRPVYLFLDDSRYDLPGGEGAKYVCLPPLRSIANQQALWDGLRNGEIHTYATDHAPWLAAQKLAPGRFSSIPAGVANLQTSIGMLYSEGVGRGRISLTQFVAVTATNPAKLFGLWPQKGTLAVGADADVVLIDPKLKKRLGREGMESRSDYDPYEGFECMGWPVLTMSRGEIVYEQGVIKSAPGRGRFLRRSRYQPL